MPNVDSVVWFGLIYLFNGTSTPYGLFNADLRFLWRWSHIYFFNVSLHVLIVDFLLVYNYLFAQLHYITYSYLWFQVFLSNINNLHTLCDFKYSYRFLDFVSSAHMKNNLLSSWKPPPKSEYPSLLSLLGPLWTW